MVRTAQLTWHSLAEAAELVRTRAVSPVELTRACVDRIERVDAAIHAFASFDAAHALEEARAAECEIQSGRYRGPLHGIPFALKDNYDTVGDPTRNGSQVFACRMPTQHATTWERLKQAGAILLAKTTMSEAAWGVDSPPSATPGTRGAIRESRLAAPQLPSPQASASWRWDQIREGPSASPQDCAGLWG
jgi:aspartyl-tRNA(Asn)/glutamyl-tRNA(Gln) amidotransferase subunit A